MKSFSHHTAGFTLIELMIAIGIFAVFITIITGIFSRFVAVERHSIAQGRLISDTMSAVESFIKEARTGYGATYTSNEDGSSISFRNQNNECVIYQKSEQGALERAASDTSDDCIPGALAQNRFTPLTSNATILTSLKFTPVIAEPDNGVLKNQGVITIAITAKSTSDVNNLAPMSVQNSVTSRQMQPYVTP